MQTKKPMRKETVGAQYYAFNTPAQNGDFDPTTYEETIKSEVVKSVNIKENAENTPVYSSGKIYDNQTQKSSDQIEVETVAFPKDDLAKMRGETVDNGGLVLSGATAVRPYFAYGKVVKKFGGGFRYEWFPKCQLIENTDETSTSEESPAEQNESVTISAMPFDDAGNTKTYVDTELSNFPEGLTEEQFFTKPIVTKEDLLEAIGVEGA